MKPDSISDALQISSGNFGLESLGQSLAGGPCDTDLRTTTVNVNNLSSWTVEIAFFHLQSVKVTNVPPNYQKNTGVFVAVQELGPNRASPELDTCLVGGRNKPIAADWFERGFKMRIFYNGQTYYRDLKNLSTNPTPGKYWRGGPLTAILRDTPALVSVDGPPMPEVAFEWLTSDSMTG